MGASYWYINKNLKAQWLLISVFKKNYLQRRISKKKKQNIMRSISILLPVYVPFLWKLCKSWPEHLILVWFSSLSFTSIRTFQMKNFFLCNSDWQYHWNLISFQKAIDLPVVTSFSSKHSPCFFCIQEELLHVVKPTGLHPHPDGWSFASGWKNLDIELNL